MSSSGHSVRSESANSPTVSSSLALRRCASSPMMPTNRSRAALSMSGKRRDRLDRGAHAGERRAGALRQRLQQQVAAIAGLDPAGDVVEHQHEPRDAVRRGARRPRGDGAPQHRRHLHAHELARGGGRDEVRDRAAVTLAQPVVDAFQRVDDEVAVEDREDRAPEPDEAVRLPGRGGAVERLAQELHRAGVVQQDAPFDVAHDHALRELRHQRREPVSLLLDALVRLAHAPVEVALQRLVGGGERVEALGEPPDLGGAARAARGAPDWPRA